MKTRRSALRMLATLPIALTGCTALTKKINDEKSMTGLFNDDPTVLEERFGKIIREKTTRKELLELGFDPKAKNVDTFTGVPAFRRLFGPDVFRQMDGNNFSKRLPEYNQYELWVIPYVDTRMISSRVFMNEKRSHTTGSKSYYTIVLHDDVVVYAAADSVTLDQTQVEKFLISGPLALLRELGGAVGFVR